MSATMTTVCKKMAVAVEIASAKWVVASYAGGAHKIRCKTLTQATAAERLEALLAEMDEARRRFGLEATARVMVAYEAGQEGFWLVRALAERGLDARVIDPVSLPVDRRARRAKTDRLDARALVLGVWRYLHGEGGTVRMVRVADAAAEDAREWQRERDRLARERRSCADRIRKKLRTQGIWLLPPDWHAALRQGRLRTFDGRPLGAMLQAALVVELDRLEAAEAHLKQWARQVEQMPQAVTQRVARLASLRGIGQVGARALALQLYWRHFYNRRQVGACVGLVGVPHDSGTMRCDQGISKAGDPRLRALLVELAWLWLRYQPGSAISQWFVRRTQGAGKRGKRIMIVAVARKLAIALWKYLQYGVIPEGARMKACPAAA